MDAILKALGELAPTLHTAAAVALLHTWLLPDSRQRQSQGNEDLIGSAPGRVGQRSSDGRGIPLETWLHCHLLCGGQSWAYQAKPMPAGPLASKSPQKNIEGTQGPSVPSLQVMEGDKET